MENSITNIEELKQHDKESISFKNLDRGFLKARSVHKWNEKYGNTAIGIFENELNNKNKKIFVVKMNSTIYFIDRDTVDRFFQTNRCAYLVNEKTVYNIPTRLWKIIKK